MMAIDWNKPLELLDGTSIRLIVDDETGETNHAANPDPDGDYWIEREDGQKIASTDRSARFKEYRQLCVHANGCEEGTATVIVRNRARLAGDSKDAATLPTRLRTCADQSEMGRNFADTPQACRAAANRIEELEESPPPTPVAEVIVHGIVMVGKTPMSVTDIEGKLAGSAKIIRDLLEHAQADYAHRGGAGDGAIANAQAWLAVNG